MDIPLFDGHCDTAWRINKYGTELKENTGHIDIVRGRAYHPYKQFFALYADHDCADDFPGLYRQMLGKFLAEIEKNRDSITLCRTAAQGDEAARQGKIGAFLSVEGGEILSCATEQLDMAFSDGVRCIAPVWNYDNPWCGSAMDSGSGLTSAGADAVKRAVEKGMIVDVSHMSRNGFFDLCRVTDAPFAATHSNSFALCPHPRNLTDEQFRAIAERGGTVGINLYSGFLGENADLDTVVRHIEHFLDLDGEKTVCLGCDLDGCDELPRGVAGIENLSELYSALERRGYPSRLLSALFHDNMNRMVEKICVI